MITTNLPAEQVPAIDLAADEPQAPSIPATAHQAYCLGVTAAQQSTDISAVIYDATLHWPLANIGTWCELVACMSLGFWSTTFRAERRDDEELADS